MTDSPTQNQTHKYQELLRYLQSDLEQRVDLLHLLGLLELCKLEVLSKLFGLHPFEADDETNRHVLGRSGRTWNL